MRPELVAIVDALLRGRSDAGEIELDAVGDAIGALPVTQAEIEAIFAALEQRGCRLVARRSGHGESHLARVLAAARALAAELGRTPTVDEIVARSGLEPADVRHALALVRVMQR